MSTSPTELLDILRRNRDRILEEWARLVRAELPVSGLLADALRTHVPGMLDALVEALALGRAERPHEPLKQQAREHAEQRHRLGYALEQVVREYALLRNTFVRVLLSECPQPPIAEMELLHLALDQAVVESVTTYARASTRELETERQQLRHALEFRDRVLGIVSHDLRNPLNAITLSAAMLLRRGNLDERVQQNLQRIVNASDRAHRLIRDLLDYTRARLGGGIPLEPRPCDLGEVAQQVVDEVALAFPERMLHLLRATERDLRGEWDPDRLAQVVTNLTRNAVRHSPSGTPVRVTVHADERSVGVDVHNEGPPIAPELLPTLFEPFTQGSERHSHEGNMGLGLYISRELARAHGGRLEVESRQEEGTTFRLVLPRTPSP
ncbi:ATP-binding protein [Archangium sp.]|uniref:ATP-binding protein n=1 Tax=Archangium sp. TaxID=1872627 RepID=UPI00389A64F5